MQTLLPVPDFDECARYLDRQRLGKQRVECLQIMRALIDGGSWSNHPAVRMWRGHEPTLFLYSMAICKEWKARGYKDTCEEKLRHEVGRLSNPNSSPPAWLGDAKFHASHRSNLLRKNREWYSQWGWKESPDLDYVWPT